MHHVRQGTAKTTEFLNILIPVMEDKERGFERITRKEWLASVQSLDTVKGGKKIFHQYNQMKGAKMGYAIWLATFKVLWLSDSSRLNNGSETGPFSLVFCRLKHLLVYGIALSKLVKK